MLRALECGLIAIGFMALTCAAFVLGDAAVAQQRAFTALADAHTLTAVITQSHVVAALPDLPPASEAPRRGAPFAVLDIPRLHVSEAVLEGSDDGTLRRGPGHIDQTSVIGDAGNVGIAGHRDTFFRPLSRVHVGDDIVMTTAEHTSRYRVSSIRIVLPTDLSVLDTTDVPTLTLVTCYPFGFVGPAPLRYIVRAVRVDSAQAGPRVSTARRDAVSRIPVHE